MDFHGGIELRLTAGDEDSGSVAVFVTKELRGSGMDTDIVSDYGDLRMNKRITFDPGVAYKTLKLERSLF